MLLLLCIEAFVLLLYISPLCQKSLIFKKKLTFCLFIKFPVLLFHETVSSFHRILILK